MSGIIANYSTAPRLRTIVTNSIVNPVGGSNPVDLSPVDLTNVRGQLSYEIISGDNSYSTTFGITGGFGQFQTDPTRNFYLARDSVTGATINEVAVNRFEILTDVADAGGRRYILQFRTSQSFGPTITQTSVNTLGNNTLTVRVSKVSITQGF